MDEFDIDYQDQINDAQSRLVDARRRSQFSAPETKMVSGYLVNPSPIDYLSAALRSAGASREAGFEQNKVKELTGKKNQAVLDALRNFQEASTAKPAALLPEDQEGPQRPPIAPDMRAAYAQLLRAPDASIRSFAIQGMGQLPALETRREEKEQDRSFRQSLLDQSAAERRRAEEVAQNNRMETIRAQNEAALERQRQNQEFLKVLKGAAGAADVQRKPPAGYRFNDSNELEPIPGGPAASKPAPVAITKEVNEAVDALAVASGVAASTQDWINKIDGGELILGPAQNLKNTARNMLGASNETSRNLASFDAFIEKLRNDSLRLNKGVQTDGDAQRALNELFKNKTDPQVVRQRLSELQAINKRGAELQKLKADRMQAEYGGRKIDFSPYEAGTPTAGGMNPNAPIIRETGDKIIRFDQSGRRIP